MPPAATVRCRAVGFERLVSGMLLCLASSRWRPFADVGCPGLIASKGSVELGHSHTRRPRNEGIDRSVIPELKPMPEAPLVGVKDLPNQHNSTVASAEFKHGEPPQAAPSPKVVSGLAEGG